MGYLQAKDAQGHLVTKGEAPFAVRACCGDEEVAGALRMHSRTPFICASRGTHLLRLRCACSMALQEQASSI